MTFLIDPSDVIDYERSDADLELFYLFCLVVAGKTAATQARLLQGFLNDLPSDSTSPFERMRSSPDLYEAVKASRLGQYNRLYRAFADSLSLDLRSCTVADLEAIHGVGPKTARMFLMMSRANQRYAALDTHVLKHLRANGIEAPKATPSGSKYRMLELEFLRLADAASMAVSEYDLMVWKTYARKDHAEVA